MLSFGFRIEKTEKWHDHIYLPNDNDKHVIFGRAYFLEGTKTSFWNGYFWVF